MGSIVEKVRDCIDKINKNHRLADGGKHCGGEWKKAANSDRSSKKNLSIGGRMLASCNHMVIYAAVNMLGTGEKYAYVYLIFYLYFVKHQVKAVYGNLMCKWYPWMQKLVEKLATLLKSIPMR
jgi:hypothetical protein